MRDLCYNARAMEKNDFEIERKFLIRRPSREYLEENARGSQILQTYLINQPGETRRVRKRWTEEDVQYTYTCKKKINSLRRMEYERDISGEEYEKLLAEADPARRAIQKERWILNYGGQMFEIDLFPFWQTQAYLELELEREDQVIIFPPELVILREVTEDKRYTNSALAKEVPPENV